MIDFRDCEPGLTSEQEKKESERQLLAQWDIDAKQAGEGGKVCPTRRVKINDTEYFGPCYQSKCRQWDKVNDKCGATIIIIPNFR